MLGHSFCNSTNSGSWEHWHFPFTCLRYQPLQHVWSAALHFVEKWKKKLRKRQSCAVPVVLTQINFLQIWDFCFLQIWAAQANAFWIGRSATSANSLFSSVFLTACFFWTSHASFLWISKEKDWIEMARSKPKSPLCSLNQKGLVPSPIHLRQPAESPGRITHKIKAKWHAGTGEVWQLAEFSW